MENQVEKMTRGKRPFTIVVADSHNLFRRGLATLIAAEADLEVRGEAATVEQALALVTPPPPNQNDLGDSSVLWDLPQSEFQPVDILVMEMSMVQQDPNVVKALRQLPETTSVLLLAAQESPDCLETTMAAGARGYMVKTTPPTQLITGIRQATVFADHDSHGLSRQAPDLQALAQTGRSYARTSSLTAREQEVTTLLAEGRTVREVALELSLSIKTIEAHKLNLMRKLDIHNRASLVDYAVRSGLISVPAEK